MQEDLKNPKTNNDLKATLQPHLPHSIWLSTTRLINLGHGLFQKILLGFGESKKIKIQGFF